MADDLAELLGATSLFAGASEDSRHRLAQAATMLRLSARDWLFRAGDSADALFVVASGRLCAMLEQPELTTLGNVVRGEVVGELALLTGAPRSASVRALRDSELIRIGAQDFAALLREDPELTLTLTRVLGERLQKSRAIDVPAPPRPATIALIPATADVPMRELRRILVEEMGGLESVVELAGHEHDDPSDFGPLLDRLEREHDQVLLSASEPDHLDSWTAFCLRQADRVIVVAGPTGPPADWRAGVLVNSDLAFCAPQSGPGGIVRWIEALAPRRRYLLRPGERFEPGVARMARRLAGRSIGIVLSGGGARGFAHLGVIEELIAGGLEIDRVGGTSMGGLVGALFASGLTIPEACAQIRHEFIEHNPLNDYTIPLVAMTRGLKGRAMMVRLFGELRIEELERDYFCVSCDLVGNEVVTHRSGELIRAVGATTSLPGFVPPVPDNGRMLVDGGVMNNLPVQLMARDEGPVIAVNVTDLSRQAPPRQRRLTRARLLTAAHRRIAGIVEEFEPLGLMDTIMRTVVLGSADANLLAERHADFLITPDVAGVDLLAWALLPEMRQAGRDAARQALAGELGELAGTAHKT